MSNKQEFHSSNSLMRELREGELDFVFGGINSKFDELESSVDSKQADLVQRLGQAWRQCQPGS